MGKFKRLIIVLLVIILSNGFIGCNKSVKESIISSDVKKDIEKEEKNSIKVEKINEFSVDNFKYIPLYWKDDENFIAAYEDSLSLEHNIYSVNINTGETTEIGALNDAIIVTGSYPNGDELQGARLLFIRDFKLWVYDISTNTSKIIYDLSEVKNEIEEELSKYTVEKVYNESGKYLGIKASAPKSDQEKFKIENPIDFFNWIRAGFVKGSDKYVYINSSGGLRILDLDTGKAVKLTPLKPYKMERIQNKIVYSKITDAFYLSTYNDSDIQMDEILYSVKISNPNEFKEVIRMPRISLRSAAIADDGKLIYFSTYNDKQYEDSRASNSIATYDVTSNTVTKLFEDKSDIPYFFYDYNYKNGLSYYGYGNVKSFYDSSMVFLGSINRGKLKVVENITPENRENSSHNICSIIYNKNNDKFIQRIDYYDNNPSLLERKIFVYALKNKS